MLDKNTVIDMLTNYTRYKELLSQIQTDFTCISAYTYSDVPPSITNKFHSVVENIALWRSEEAQLEKIIHTIDSWTRYLQNESRFVITEFYFRNRTYPQITSAWEKQEGILHHETYWARCRKKAIYDICKMYEKKGI